MRIILDFPGQKRKTLCTFCNLEVVLNKAAWELRTDMEDRILCALPCCAKCMQERKEGQTPQRRRSDGVATGSSH